VIKKDSTFLIKEITNQMKLQFNNKEKSLIKDFKYIIYVDDNFHYQDEEERYTLGGFKTEAEAVIIAKKIVDEFLLSHYKNMKTADELFELYCGFGENPWISFSIFNAWDYAKQRCNEICIGS
jgi:hypothetical protein